MSTPLIIGPAEADALQALREKAVRAPVDIREVIRTVKTKGGLRRHMARTHRFTIAIPVGFEVTFTIETGHPDGTFRHMSMSAARPDRVPNEHGLWMVAEALGFIGDLRACHIYKENITNGVAINVVQPVAMHEAARA